MLYLQGYQAVSPHHNNDLMASSLPPMSTFRGPGQPGYQSSSPTVNGSQGEMPPSQQPPPPPQQQQPNNNSSAPPPTGNGPAGSGSQSDALGNALKSVSTVSHFLCGRLRWTLDNWVFNWKNMTDITQWKSSINSQTETVLWDVASNKSECFVFVILKSAVYVIRNMNYTWMLSCGSNWNPKLLFLWPLCYLKIT